jgi:hypothetical protein
MLKKILLPWTFIMAAVFLGLGLPHREFNEVGYVNLGLQLLLCLLCIQMVRYDDGRFRPALLALTFFFGYAMLMYLSIFVGTVLFGNNLYAPVYYHQFVNKIGSSAIISVVVVYLIVDYVLHDSRMTAKLAIVVTVVALFLVPLYSPYFVNPLHLYQAEEYSRYLELKVAREQLRAKLQEEPSENHIIQRAIDTRKERAGVIEPSSTQGEASELKAVAPYLSHHDDTVLFWKPLNLSAVYVNGILMILLAGFYVAKFRHDRPQGAYIEKIMLLFFPLCSLQALHSWAHTRSGETNLYYSIQALGQYVTILVLLGFVYVCSVRLRFLLSPAGQYYERQIFLNPERITRWRDEIDNLVLKSIFRKNPLFGRLLTFQKKNQPKPSSAESKL